MRKTNAIVLAAGKGSRMKTDLPKVLVEIAGKSIVTRIVETLEKCNVDEIILIVNTENKPLIEEVMGNRCKYIIQEQQLGTAHAVLQAKDYLKDFEGNTIVMVGDSPAISSEYIRLLIDKMESADLASVFLTVDIKENIPPWGRVIRNRVGRIIGVIEDKDCSTEEKEITELIPSQFIFNNKLLFEALGKIKNNNIQKEYILSDIVGILAENYELETIEVNDIEAVYGVNTIEEKEMIELYLKRKEISNG